MKCTICFRFVLLGQTGERYGMLKISFAGAKRRKDTECSRPVLSGQKGERYGMLKISFVRAKGERYGMLKIRQPYLACG